MVEWYEAYSDYLEQMVRFETLVARLCEDINGTTRIMYGGRSLDLTPPWPRLPMLDALREIAGIDVSSVSVEDMPLIFEEHHPDGRGGVPVPLTWGGAVVVLFEALVEKSLWDPVFVMDHPVEISPLTKRHRSDRRLVERFEPVIAGMEVGNAYSELNDPVEQYNRLVSQQVGRDDVYDLDREFLQAVAHGMPPAGGTGLGVDRIVMILTGAESIRDVVFFPLASRQHAGSRQDASVNRPKGEAIVSEGGTRQSALASPEAPEACKLSTTT
jgi:lysyl-tRNA synthetase class 2